MRRYEKYKPSGVEWLGEIPEHWEVKRVKDIFREFGSGTTPSTANVDYYEDGNVNWLNTNDLSNDLIYETKQKITKKAQRESGLKTYPVNSLAIAMYGQGKTRGTVGLLQVPSTTNQASCIMFKPIKTNTKYVLYWFIHKYEDIRSLNTGATQPNMNQDFVKFLTLHFPLYEEQTAIANYLDTKTAAIDRKIELLTAKTAKYKVLRRSLINETVCRGLNPNALLKDSGIEWIGQIPAHWEVKRFKDVVAKYTTGGTPTTSNTDYFEGNNIWVCISDISESAYIYDSKIKLTDEAIRSLNIIKTPKGSLLFSFKLSIGKIAFVEKSVYTNEAILSIFPNKNIDLKYYYFMLPIFMLLAATENIYGAKMLNQKLIANALVVHPSIEEQSIIAEHLENKTAQIDTILTNISNQINKLKQLRKTLINGVVTGKIKVTED